MNYIQRFIDDCQARGLTKHTIETYRSNVKTYLGAYNEPDKIDLDDLRSFLGDLRDRGLQGSTLKGYFAAVSALYDFLIFEGELSSNPIPPFRKRYLSRLKQQQNGENTRQLISIQQMQLLISQAASDRETALIMMLAKTGMRRGEALSLTIDDIDLRRRVIRIPAKAKRSNRLAFIDGELQAALEKYLVWRKQHARSVWLWITAHGGRVHKDYPGRILARLGEALDLHDPRGPLCSKLTPHCFRHFFTTHLRRAGMNHEIIKFLRGDSLRSEAWQIYDHIDPEEARDEYLMCIPRLMPEQAPQITLNRCSNSDLNPGHKRRVKS